MAESSIWADTRFKTKMNNKRNIERMPAWPGVFVELFDSSFKLTAVSHPQKKNKPSTHPTASPL